MVPLGRKASTIKSVSRLKKGEGDPFINCYSSNRPIIDTVETADFQLESPKAISLPAIN